MPFLSTNPSTNELIKSYPDLTLPEIRAKIDDAAEAFTSWKQTTYSQRASVLHAFADLLESQQDDLAKLITLEMGKRYVESQGEIRFCSEITRFYADQSESLLADQPFDLPSANAFLRFDPLGVILGVMPWNFPFYQVVRFAMPNLMVGNTVLLKHATSVPQCAEKIEQLFETAGLPTKAYQNLFAPVEMVNDIIDDSRVRGVSLTGSERAGSEVARRAGMRIKKSVLELGGNDAFIVLDDANLKKTVRSAVAGRTRNTGQSCVGSKRFIVVEDIAEQFIAAFSEAMSQLRVGDPMAASTQLGPLSTEQAAVRLDEQVQSAVAAGAKLLLGGSRPEGPGAYYPPTILVDVEKGSPTYDAELFGPVATIYVVKDESAAIELANDSSYGLGGSVFTDDVARGQRVAEQIETGMVFVNEPTRSQARLPFGGIKNSGYGRELSHLALEEFVNKKLIHVPK